MFIELLIEKARSSVGATCRSDTIPVFLMPLLRTLGFSARFAYKYGAPNGAIISLP